MLCKPEPRQQSALQVQPSSTPSQFRNSKASYVALSTERYHGCVDTVNTSTPVTRTDYKETRDKSVLPMSPIVSFWLGLIRRPISHFRGLEGRTPEAWAYGISVPLELPTSTEALPRVWIISSLRELNRLACYSRRSPCHGHNDANFDANAPLPDPVQIGVCP